MSSKLMWCTTAITSNSLKYPNIERDFNKIDKIKKREL